ncbi:MAG: hypothetical protein KYX69_06085 [Sphingomonas sp.]|uniref:hypothetical protein n=1 Tax=Sphingomonas sp. TaxID=28214 RepID=UPI002618F2E6|nr:hypothetical protein [Sphingomonas sp.]MDK2767273.1 hypothetical protein [Sphingomonas sp.]
MDIENNHRCAFSGCALYAKMIERPLERLIEYRPKVIDQRAADAKPMVGQLIKSTRPDAKQFAVYSEWGYPEALKCAALCAAFVGQIKCHQAIGKPCHECPLRGR